MNRKICELPLPHCTTEVGRSLTKALRYARKQEVVGSVILLEFRDKTYLTEIKQVDKFRTMGYLYSLIQECN